MSDYFANLPDWAARVLELDRATDAARDKHIMAVLRVCHELTPEFARLELLTRGGAGESKGTRELRGIIEESLRIAGADARPWIDHCTSKARSMDDTELRQIAFGPHHLLG